MLHLSKYINRGANRICFEHPDNPNQCIKITINPEETNILENEIKNYIKVKDRLEKYILKYETTLVATNQGPAMACELLRDDNGQYAKTLDFYEAEKLIDDSLKTQILDFCRCLRKEKLFFYDFNLKNFIIQIKNNQKHLYYTDLKSYESYKPLTFLRLEKIFSPLASHLMERRLRKFLKKLNIEE